MGSFHPPAPRSIPQFGQLSPGRFDIGGSEPLAPRTHRPADETYSEAYVAGRTPEDLIDPVIVGVLAGLAGIGRTPWYHRDRVAAGAGEAEAVDGGPESAMRVIHVYQIPFPTR